MASVIDHPVGDNIQALLRSQLAVCTRLLVMEGLLNYSGHVSARVPGRDALLIQTRTESRAEVSPDSVIMCDFDGNVLEGDPGKPPSELPIHTQIYRARPEIQAVIHNHNELAASFTMVKGAQILPIRSYAVRWKDGIPTHRDPSHIKSIEQADALAASLGKCNVALMRGHGIVLVAESVPAILIDSVHFNENAQAQIQAQSIGEELDPLTPEEMAMINKTEIRDHHVAKIWNYYVNKGRKLGVIDPSWDVIM